AGGPELLRDLERCRLYAGRPFVRLDHAQRDDVDAAALLDRGDVGGDQHGGPLVPFLGLGIAREHARGLGREDHELQQAEREQPHGGKHRMARADKERQKETPCPIALSPPSRSSHSYAAARPHLATRPARGPPPSRPGRRKRASGWPATTASKA